MNYVSTRGSAEPSSFRDVVLSGSAPDGGLYIPEKLPTFEPLEIASWAWLPFEQLAFHLIAPFVAGEIDDASLLELLGDCYRQFAHRATAPLQQIGHNEWIMQLHHGPTGASKDFAAQLHARLIKHFLSKSDNAILIGATNGDTGLAAVQAFKGVSNVQVVVVYPREGVPSDRLIALHEAESQHVELIEIDGSFDDCQTLVSRLLRSWPRSDAMPVSFNSTNWVGVLAQIVFFFYSALQLGGSIRPVGFSIPGASFAEIYACFIAKQMGLPISQVVVSTNMNDSLHRLINKNLYSVREISPSLSPSMDYSFFSNLERLVFELYKHDGAAVLQLMSDFENTGLLTLGNKEWREARMLFDSYAVGDEQAQDELLTLHRETGIAVDPQTATGALAGRLYRRSISNPMVTLAQLAPSKSAKLLSDLGVWDERATTPSKPIFPKPQLMKGDVEGLSRLIEALPIRFFEHNAE